MLLIKFLIKHSFSYSPVSMINEKSMANQKEWPQSQK
jgi:hypothetical protein